MSDFKTRIAEYSELLPVGTSVSYTEASRRAGVFLMALAFITDIKHILSEEKIRATTVQTATFAQKMSEGTAKTVTENKLIAEASREYAKSREELETVENDISYLKAYYDIFMAAHVFYRQMSKEGN